MLDKFNGNSTVIKILRFFFGDTVLIYTVLIMMSVMYHYRSSLIAVYGIAALVIGAFLFRLFDYIAKHKLIGSAAYIAVFTVFILATKISIEKGAQSYPISFGVWFLTPQDALDYSKWYTFAIFLLFMIFMASVIYYFTKIRYRIFMNALIFIIPFALYGKEYEKMPTAFIMLLAIGYIAIMIRCRQIADSEKVHVVNKSIMWISAAVYIVIFASVAAIIPKPEVEANREMLETMIAADQFTDNLMNLLNVFQDTSTGEQFRSSMDDTPIYFVKADEPLRLKTLTYSTYDYSTDSWSVTENDTRYVYTNDEQEIEFPQTGMLLSTILKVAELNSSFAEEYGLENLSTDNITYSDIKTASVYTVTTRSQFAPVPPLVTRLRETSYEDSIAVLRSGLIYCDDDYFRYNEKFVYDYCADTFFSNPVNKELADIMSRDDYADLLQDSALIASYAADDEDFELLIDEYNNLERYESYLDYGDNQQILVLAQQITAGLETDYDKAEALESYFVENGYIYDLEYRKDKGDNAIDFLYTSKRGVCYEYATAMTLLARAAGIPARYCEGYNMSELYNSERLGTNYIVKSRDAHGFPELYIRGVGWVSFEPTVSTFDTAVAEKNATDKLSSAGVFLLILALVFLLLVKFYPAISHKILLIRLNKASASEAVILIMHRICRIYKVGKAQTSQEAADYIYSLSGCDISVIAAAFDAVAYGENIIPESEKNCLTEAYISSYNGYNEHKRKNKRKHKAA